MKTRRQKLSSSEAALLRECKAYSLCESLSLGRKVYYRLGGHGYAPIRYHAMRAHKLQSMGLITFGSVLRATERGLQHLNEMDAQ